MEVIVRKTPAQAACMAAQTVALAIRRKPRLVLGLATGVTMAPFYMELVRMHREEDLDFAAVTTFNLDEYLSLPPEHPASFHREMEERLFRHVNLNQARTFIPDGMTLNLDRHCREYEQRIRDNGGVDVLVLGVGSDGHIGFNEPTSSLSSRTRRKTLMERSRRDVAALFGSLEAVPHHCITMGIGTILESRQCLLLAYGSAKADVVAAAIEGPVTGMVPASALQFHPDVKFLVDEAAAAKLKLRDYYDYAFEHADSR